MRSLHVLKDACTGGLLGDLGSPLCVDERRDIFDEARFGPGYRISVAGLQSFSRQLTGSARLEGDTENVTSKVRKRGDMRGYGRVFERVREWHPRNTGHFPYVFGSPKLTRRQRNSRQVIWLPKEYSNLRHIG